VRNFDAVGQVRESIDKSLQRKQIEQPDGSSDQACIYPEVRSRRRPNFQKRETIHDYGLMPELLCHNQFTFTIIEENIEFNIANDM